MDTVRSLDDPRLETEALLEFMYLCPFGLLRIDAAGTVELANPVAAQLLMPVARNPLITNLFEALESAAPDLRNLVESFPEERGIICENRRIHVDGAGATEPMVLAVSITRIDRDQHMVVLTDVSQQAAQERRLKQADSWFSAMMSGVNDFSFLTLDENGRVVNWTESAARQHLYAESEIRGRTLNSLYLPDDAVQGRALQQITYARRDGWNIDEGWRRRKDGSRYWCQSLVSAFEGRTGGVTGFSVVLRDVTAHKSGTDELKKLLTTDHLTGILNRAHFYELGQAEIVRWTTSGRPLSALMIDADHFKAINDAHGHAVGDLVLKELAATLQRYLRPLDLFGRLGGEEFGILLPSLDSEAATMIAESLRQQLNRLKISVGAGELTITASIGCASMGGAVDSLQALLGAADEALYVAKHSGRNRVVVHGAPKAAPAAA